MYVNNQFTNLYFHALRSKTTPLAAEELRENQALLKDNLHLFEIEGEPQDKNKALKMLNKLACLKPGSKILRKLIAIGKKITIAFDPNAQPFFFPETNKIDMNNSFDFYVNGITSSGEIILPKIKQRYIFGHELTHASHDEHQAEEGKSLLNDDLDDPEEQVTITGIEIGTEKASSKSENGFKIASGEEWARLDHRAVVVPKGHELTPSQWAAMRGGFPLIQKALKEDPQSLNQSYPFYILPSYPDGVLLRPLTVAIISKRWDDTVSELLKDPTIRVDYCDDGGTPLEVALKAKRFDIALQIIKHPTFDPQMIDREGNTPLLVAILETESLIYKSAECRQVLDVLTSIS